jgi:hypothetical protein
MQEWHDLKVDNINLSLVYFATLGKISFTKTHLDGKITEGMCLIINLLKNRASTKDKGFLGYEQGQVFFKLFLVRVIFVIKNSTSKKIEMFEGVKLDLFLEGRFSTLGPSFS